MKKARPISIVFLDRDGVINHDSPDYIKTPEEFRFLPQSAEAIGCLTAAGLDIILITNQSVIHRGLVSSKGLTEIFDKLVRGVTPHGGKIRDIFFCPHTPEDRCGCRKPAPGMLLAARDKHGLDLSDAVMVGDSAKDIQAARAAGVGTAILVLTGNGESARKTLESAGTPPDVTVENLMAAARWIIRERCQ